MSSKRKKPDIKKERPPVKENGINAPVVSAEKNRTPVIKTDDIRLIAEPLCESEGMELVHVEYQREPGGEFSVFI